MFLFFFFKKLIIYIYLKNKFGMGYCVVLFLLLLGEKMLEGLFIILIISWVNYFFLVVINDSDDMLKKFFKYFDKIKI